MKKIAKYIDHTLLKADATLKDIEKLCLEAKEYNFCSVCINSSFIKDAKRFLEGSDVKICTVVGFPLGACNSSTKAHEAKTAIEDGANEIDMVINVGLLKSKELKKVKEDIETVFKACEGTLLKVILETALLNEEELRQISLTCKEIGVDFIKTSTGFSTRGASVEDVKIMKECVGDEVKIKASGGIRDYETAVKMIEAGADRLGVSAGVAIVNGEKSASLGGY